MNRCVPSAAALAMATAGVLLIAAPAVAATADPSPGTARFAAPKRGDAVVVPGDGGSSFQYRPFAGKRTLTVLARLRSAVPGRPRRILMKQSTTTRPCARSYAADRGRGIALATGVAEPGGWISVSSKERRMGSGLTRFCIWMTSQPRRRTKPVASDVRFIRDGIGVVALPYRVPTPLDVLMVAASTGTFQYASTDSCDPRSAESPRTSTATDARLASLYSFFPSDPRCDRNLALSITGSVGGALSVALSAGEAAAGTIRSAGRACVLPRAAMPRDDAERLLRAQSCRVGRALRARRDDTDLRPPGWVWSFAVHGAAAELVPQHTTVDLVLNEAP